MMTEFNLPNIETIVKNVLPHVNEGIRDQLFDFLSDETYDLSSAVLSEMIEEYHNEPTWPYVAPAFGMLATIFARSEDEPSVEFKHESKDVRLLALETSEALMAAFDWRKYDFFYWAGLYAALRELAGATYDYVDLVVDEDADSDSIENAIDGLIEILSEETMNPVQYWYEAAVKLGYINRETLLA